VAQGVSTEFKPQYHKKKEGKENKRREGEKRGEEKERRGMK
jgi:hypothetical protein